MTYAARHPDLFGVALSYSGAVETWYDLTERSTLVGLISYFEAYDGLIPGTVFGDPVTDGMNWAAHDPATLAANLLDTRMMFYCGDGEPGPLDPIATLPSENLSGEPVANLETKGLQSRLNSLGIPATYDYYGAGTHNWPYWNRDLQWSIDSIMNDFAHPAPVPQDFTYTSAEPEYNVYGWSVAANRNTLAFTTLSVTGASAFTLAGIGTATVTTSRRYRPGRTYVINLMPDGQTPIRDRVTASQDGRLTITVPLGTGDAPESAGLTAAAPSTPDDPTTVTISRVTQRKGTVSRRLPRSV